MLDETGFAELIIEILPIFFASSWWMFDSLIGISKSIDEEEEELIRSSYSIF